MAIRAGKDRPQQAAVAVPYSGNWFWIDANDRESKLTMMALSLFYRLLESGNPGNLPVLTIPAG